MSKVMPMDSPPQPGDYFTVHPNVGNKDYCSGQGYKPYSVHLLRTSSSISGREPKVVGG